MIKETLAEFSSSHEPEEFLELCARLDTRSETDFAQWEQVPQGIFAELCRRN